MAVSGFSAVAGMLAIASLAWACTAPVGGTWYSDGSTSKSGAPGTVVRVFASGAFENLPYTLVLGDGGTSPGHGDHACMRTLDVLNPNTRLANNTGFISTTVGTVHHTTPGTYQLCFKDNTPANTTGTSGASFTVI